MFIVCSRNLLESIPVITQVWNTAGILEGRQKMAWLESLVLVEVGQVGDGVAGVTKNGTAEQVPLQHHLFWFCACLFRADFYSAGNIWELCTSFRLSAQGLLRKRNTFRRLQVFWNTTIQMLLVQSRQSCFGHKSCNRLSGDSSYSFIKHLESTKRNSRVKW